MVKGEMKNWTLEDWDNDSNQYLDEKNLTIQEARERIDTIREIMAKKQQEFSELDDYLRRYRFGFKEQLDREYDDLYSWMVEKLEIQM